VPQGYYYFLAKIKDKKPFKWCCTAVIFKGALPIYFNLPLNTTGFNNIIAYKQSQLIALFYARTSFYPGNYSSNMLCPRGTQTVY